MSRKAFSKTSSVCLGLAVTVLVSGLLARGVAAAADPVPSSQPDDQPETVTLVTHANSAAKAYRNGDFATAEREYKWCIGDRPRAFEFYEGLYNSARHNNEWDQVAFALEKMFQLNPSCKLGLTYEYGQALFHLNRYSEAVPILKAALKTVDLNEPDWTPQIKDMPAGNGIVAAALPDQAALTAAAQAKAEAEAKAKEERIRREQEDFNLTFLNAATKSEFIGIAEYLSYEKDADGDIGWNLPPQANYLITDILKGPPLNPRMPVRYEFHDHVHPQMPAGWKFDPKIMPAKGSKWIIFLESGAPKRAMFETYQGSYGRQPATDENVNALYELLDKYNMRNTHS